MECTSVITISRQFGSGGREIGQKLAQRLNIDFYDKELLSLAAKESGIDPSAFENVDEHAANSLLYGLSLGMYGFVQTGYSSYEQFSMNDRLYLLQHEIIRKLADKPCVIVGRCADYVLKNRDNCMNIFIYADLDYRIERAVTVRNVPKEKAESVIRKTDKARANYYQFYTEQKWGVPDNYHLCLNSAKLSVEKAVDVIESYVNAFQSGRSSPNP